MWAANVRSESTEGMARVAQLWKIDIDIEAFTMPVAEYWDRRQNRNDDSFANSAIGARSAQLKSRFCAASWMHTMAGCFSLRSGEIA